jgi:hypothetical protein
MATVALSGIITPTNVVTATSTTTLTNKTLTGAVVNGTVGATTPSTGAFTSVRATSLVSTGTSQTAGANQLALVQSGATSILVSYGAGVGSGNRGAYDFYQSDSAAGNIQIPLSISSAGAVSALTTFAAGTTMGVGGATPSASGSGITFPATQSASTDANTLDDYEEGTWTPTVRGGSTAGTYTPNNISAYYTKVGNQVTCWANFGFSAASGGTGEILIQSLPFSYKASSSIAGSIVANSLNTSAASSNGMGIQNSTQGSAASLFISLNIDNAAQEEVASGAVTTSTTLLFTVTYTVS